MNPVDPTIVPEVAVIVPVPIPIAEKLPVWEMLPTETPLVIAQWQVVVMFCVLPSLKCPVAVNCTGPDKPMNVMLAGVTVIDCKTALLTVSDNVPLTPLSVALAVKDPVVRPVATPEELTTPTEDGCVDHETRLVRFCVELSE